MTKFQKTRLVPVAQKLAPRSKGIDVAWQNDRDPDTELFTLNDSDTLMTLDEIRAKSQAATLIIVEYVKSGKATSLWERVPDEPDKD